MNVDLVNAAVGERDKGAVGLLLRARVWLQERELAGVAEVEGDSLVISLP